MMDTTPQTPPCRFSPFSSFSLRAVLIGMGVDWACTILLAIAYGAFTALDAISRGACPLEAQDGLSIPFFIAGGLATVLGGYVTARLAAVEKMRHVCIFALATMLQGVLLQARGDFADHFTWWLAGELATGPAALLGGFLYLNAGKAQAPTIRL